MYVTSFSVWHIFLSIWKIGRWLCALKMFWSGTDVQSFYFSEGEILTYCYFVLMIIASNFGGSLDANWTTILLKSIHIRRFIIFFVKNTLAYFIVDVASLSEVCSVAFLSWEGSVCIDSYNPQLYSLGIGLTNSSLYASVFTSLIAAELVFYFFTVTHICDC